MYNRRRLLQIGSAVLSGGLMPHWALALEKMQGHWSVLADMPYKTQEIYPALLAGNIHIAGGFAAIGAEVSPTNRHIQYNIATGRWRELASLPEVRHHLQLVVCQEVLYALGGFGINASGQWVMQDQSWSYDAEADTWHKATAAPEVHAESVATVMGDSAIHIVGGRTPSAQRNASWLDHGDSVRHLIYHVGSQEWSQAAPPLHSRNSAAGANINGQLYVVGGRTVSGGNVSYLEVYDVREERWRMAAPLPQAQGGLAAAAINGQLLAFGGEFFGAEDYGVYSNTWCYNPGRDQWDAMAPMRTPRHGLGAVSDGEFVYAVGGATDVATRGTCAVLEAFSF